MKTQIPLGGYDIRRRHHARFLLLVLMFLSNALVYAADKSGLKPTVISIPSGPGSIEGLGASFEPRLNDGTCSYRVPLATPPGRNQFSPTLELVYDSGYGNGPFGQGWRLRLPHLVRQSRDRQPFYTNFPIGNGIDDDGDGEVDEFDEFDTFFWNASQELVPTTNGDWRLQNETEFVRFRRDGEGWIAQRPDGVTLFLGRVSTSRVEDGPGRAFEWRLDEMRDPFDNRILFEWEKFGPEQQTYLKKISYNEAGAMELRFSHEPRPDVLTDGRPRFALRTTHRCNSIAMFVSGALVRRYDLQYAPTTATQPLSLLAGIVQTGADNLAQLPPATFEYAPFVPNARTVALLTNAPVVDLANANVEFIDLNGDALPDILDTSTSPHGYYLNLGPKANGEVEFSAYATMHRPVNLYLAANTTGLADIDGNARTDLLNLFSGRVELFTLGHDLEWQSGGAVSNATFSLQDPEVRLLDVNGDRLIDVMMTAAGFNTVWVCLQARAWGAPVSVPSPLPSLRFSRTETRLADMNGDRIMDLVYLAEDACYYYHGLGYGVYSNRVDMTGPPSGVIDSARLVLADVNGDGMSDVIHLGNRIRIFLSLGVDPNDFSVGHFAAPFEIESPYLNATTLFRTGDINGNGSIDLILNTQIDGVRRLAYLDLAPGEQPYQLKTVRNGTGRTTTIHYRTSVADMVEDRRRGAPWPDPLPLPIPVVAEIEVHSGVPPSSKQAFRYHDGYYDQAQEEFRGFARAELHDYGDGTIPDMVTVHHFDTGEFVEAMKGTILSSEAGLGTNSASWTHYDGVDNDGDGEIDEADELDVANLFFRTRNEWRTRRVAASIPGDVREILFPYVAVVTRDIFELGRGTPVSLRSEFAYDNFGNQTNQIEHGRLDGAWGDERITRARYSAAFATGQSNWILNRLVEREVLATNGTVVARRQNFYDDESFSAANLGQVNRGALTMSLDWIDPAGPGAFVKSLRQKFDPHGNVISIYDPLWDGTDAHWREIVYDPKLEAFPVQEILHTGHPAMPRLTHSAAYDARWGVITNSVDYNNFSARFTLDAFGRLTGVIRPGERTNTLEYSYVLAHPLPDGSVINWVETRQRESLEGGTVDSRVFFDGLGRRIMTRSEGENPGQIVVSGTVAFNRRQLPEKKYLPYFEEASTLDYTAPSYQSGYTEHWYDGSGREIRIHQPADPQGGVAFATTTYEPLSRVVQDEEQTRTNSAHFGCGKRYVEDGLPQHGSRGRVREIREMVKLDDTGHAIGTVVEWKTEYRYDLLDNCTGYTDAQGNEKLAAYDALSRRMFANDPDRGWTWWAYDDAGNVLRTRDARGQEIAYDYDGVNRVTAEFHLAPAERVGGGLVPGQRWTVSAGALPARSPEIEYHYDLPAGQLDPGILWRANAARGIASAVLREEHQPENDVNHDGVVDVADAVMATRQPVAFPPLIAQNTKGQLAWARDATGEEHISYDERGRVAFSLKRIADGTNALTGFMTAYAYDSMDRVTRLTYPDRTEANYYYNSRGLLESVPGALPRCDYNPAGQDLVRELACGVVCEYGYDHRLRLSRIVAKRLRDGVNLQDLTTRYDEASNVIAVEDGRSDAVLDRLGAELGLVAPNGRQFRATQRFSYDSCHRLTACSNVQATVAFRYDRIGNLLDAESSDTSAENNLGAIESGGLSGSWNRVGRQLSDSAGPHALTAWERGQSGANRVSYDEAGNVTRHGQAFLSWNAQGRLTAFSNATQRATYGYDYNHQRTRKTVGTDNPATTLYISQTAEMRNGMLEKYVYTGGNRICRLSGARGHLPDDGADFFLRDQLGSCTFTLRGNRVIEQLAYHPYGLLRKRAAAGSNAAAYTYSGKERDAESGLHYWDARYLDGALGRFISPDPAAVATFAEPSYLNAYSYSLNNPMTYQDSDGNWAFLIPTIVAAIELYAGWETGQTLGKAMGAAWLNCDAYTRKDWTAMDHYTKEGLGFTAELAEGVLERHAAEFLIKRQAAQRITDKLSRPVVQRFRDTGFPGRNTLLRTTELVSGEKFDTSRAAIRHSVEAIHEAVVESLISTGVDVGQAAVDLTAPAGVTPRASSASAPSSGVFVSGSGPLPAQSGVLISNPASHSGGNERTEPKNK